MRGLSAVTVALLSSCYQPTECDYFNQAPVGDLAQDVLGCWEGLGAYSLVVYHFQSVGYRYVEPPSPQAGAGLVGFETWSVRGDVLTFTPDQSRAEVTSTSLRLLDYGTALRRATCRGFGFEHGETCR